MVPNSERRLGWKTPDTYTVVYTCLAEKPYFDTLATYQSLYPMSKAMIEELGGIDATKAMNNENMCTTVHTP